MPEMKSKLIAALKIIFMLAFMGAASFAGLFGMKPFGAGAFLALSAVAGPYVLAPAYVLFSFAASPGPAALIEAASLAASVSLIYFIFWRLKRNPSAVFVLIAASAGQIGHLYRILNGGNAFYSAVSLLFEAGFYLGCLPILKAVFVDRLKFRLLVTELASGGLAVIAVFLGLSALEPPYFSFGYMLLILLSSVCAYAGGAGAGVCSAVCAGLGLSLGAGSPEPISSAALIAVAVSLFSAAPRPLSALAAVMAEAVTSYYFGAGIADAPFRLLSLCAGGIIFCLLPRAFLDGIKGSLGPEKSKAAMRSMVNRLRLSTGSEIYKVGETLREMSGIMSESRKSAVCDIPLAAARLRASACSDCPDRNSCKSLSDERSWCELAKTNVESGRASVGALPQALTDGCRHLSRVVTSSAELASAQAVFSENIRFENAAKAMLSEQLGGMAGIMSAFGERAARPVGFDAPLERRIAEELTYGGIICGEALAAAAGEGAMAVTAVVRSDSFDKAAAEKLLSRLMKAPYRVTGVEESGIAGWKCVAFERRERYEVVFGVANCPKLAGEKSGDTHSFVKLGGGKFMMALCDGMGSGAEAEKVSSSAISLVENFYKAGFGSELILKSVNTFLSASGGESFSAVDICVMDLNTGETDIIKIGTPATYIKEKETVCRVEGSALPLGVLEEMRPKIYTMRLKSGEAVVLTSDGVADSFEPAQDLGTAINELPAANPKTMAENLLSAALKKGGGMAKDDMTVICARLFERI